MFEFCLAPDTSGDGTGCDNMTAIIVKFDKISNVANVGSTTKRPAAEVTKETDEEALPEKKLKPTEDTESIKNDTVEKKNSEKESDSNAETEVEKCDS